MPHPLQLTAAVPMGLEALAARELADLGYEQIKTDNGRVTFGGDLLDIARANLWLRTADRVLIKMAEFPATTFEELFEGVRRIDWADWIPASGTFPVNGRSHKSQLSSVPACQSIVKKAVVEKLKERYRADWFEETGEPYVIEVSLLNDIATITLDTTGPSLHKRGYRRLTTEAPLKETMAAAMVMISRWRPGRPLLDPFCGSGTIGIEAAMIGWNVAPGLRRTFDAERWGALPASVWKEAREEAFDRMDDRSELDIACSDIDPGTIEVARAAAGKAGFGREIRLRAIPAQKLAQEGLYGCVVTNPPYGERLGERREALGAIRLLGQMRREWDTWSIFCLSPDKAFEQEFGGPADKRRKLYNGRIECSLYQYFGPLPPREQLQKGD